MLATSLVFVSTMFAMLSNVQKPLFNSLPHNKFSDRFKFKALADDKINVPEILIFVMGRLENIMGKGENAGYQHFLLFP